MLSRRQIAPLPRLMDVSLMTVDWRHADPEPLRRLYGALLDVGVLVQIPAALTQQLSADLAPERTVLAAGTGDMATGGLTGVLSDSAKPWQMLVMKECTLDTDLLPEADVYRLSVDTSLFLADYEAQFSRFLRCCHKPAILCARGATPLATALSVCWLLLGGARAAASLTGAGGYASLAEIAMALTLHGQEGLHPRMLPAAAAAWETLTGFGVPPHQPVIGSHLFDVSSGVHVNGLLKDAESYEPFAPEAVGRERRIVLDQHSGHSAVAARLQTMGITPDSLNLSRLTLRVRALGRERGEVDAASFATLIREEQEGVCA